MSYLHRLTVVVGFFVDRGFVGVVNMVVPLVVGPKGVMIPGMKEAVVVAFVDIRVVRILGVEAADVSIPTVGAVVVSIVAAIGVEITA